MNMSANPVHFDSLHTAWFFWTETWADRYGPYPTEWQANCACACYARWLEDGEYHHMETIHDLMKPYQPPKHPVEEWAERNGHTVEICPETHVTKDGCACWANGIPHRGPSPMAACRAAWEALGKPNLYTE